MRQLLLLIPTLLLTLSCARYEYDVIHPQPSTLTAEPPTPTQRASTTEDLVLERSPITYRLRTVDSRLVLRAFNSTAEKIELLGVKSYVTTPTGKRHPLRSQPIAPGSFAKLLLPPNPPETFGADETRGGARGATGYGPGLSRREYGFAEDPLPQSNTYREPQESFWSWTGESTVRLTLVFRIKDQELTQELTLGRRRIE